VMGQRVGMPFETQMRTIGFGERQKERQAGRDQGGLKAGEGETGGDDGD